MKLVSSVHSLPISGHSTHTTGSDKTPNLSCLMTRPLPGPGFLLHTAVPTIFDILLGQATGTAVAAASNRFAFLILPVDSLQYMGLLEPMHSKPLSGQQCF